jgi:hypothetical protein
MVQNALKKLVFGCLSLIAAAANAEVCWIEKVTYRFEAVSKKGQVFIHFYNSKATVTARVIPKNKDTTYWVTNGTVERLNDPYQNEKALLVHDGDSVFLTQSVHDSCSVKIYATPERQGIQVDASSTPHGFPDSRVSKFIPAEVTRD